MDGIGIGIGTNIDQLCCINHSGNHRNTGLVEEGSGIHDSDYRCVFISTNRQ